MLGRESEYAQTSCSARLALGPLETHRIRELEVGMFQRRGARDSFAFGDRVLGVVDAECTLYASSRRLGHHVRDHVSSTERLEDGRSSGGHGGVCYVGSDCVCE